MKLVMRAALKAGMIVLMVAAAPAGVAVSFLSALGSSAPVLAAMNMGWPDLSISTSRKFVKRYKRQIWTGIWRL